MRTIGSIEIRIYNDIIEEYAPEIYKINPYLLMWLTCGKNIINTYDIPNRDIASALRESGGCRGIACWIIEKYPMMSVLINRETIRKYYPHIEQYVNDIIRRFFDIKVSDKVIEEIDTRLKTKSIIEYTHE